MKTKVITKIVCITVGLLFFSISLSIAQITRIGWSAFDMGFAVSSTPSNVSTKSMVGQLFVGTSSLANNRIEAGFLADTLLRGTIVAVKEKDEIPATFALHQNYPNPFNPTTIIRFALPNKSTVQLEIYSTLGQHIQTLVNEVREAGYYNELFDANNIASGVYFYRLHAGEFVQTRKLVLLR